MEKIDKVIGGLSQCHRDLRYRDCDVCSYARAGRECEQYLMEDALEVIEQLREENRDLRRELAAVVLRSMPNDWGEYPPEFPREGM